MQIATELALATKYVQTILFCLLEKPYFHKGGEKSNKMSKVWFYATFKLRQHGRPGKLNKWYNGHFNRVKLSVSFARLYDVLSGFCVTGEKECGQGSSHSKGVNATGSRDKARRDTRNRVTAFFDIVKNYHLEKQTLF